jgi:hypothetical protein
MNKITKWEIRAVYLLDNQSLHEIAERLEIQDLYKRLDILADKVESDCELTDDDMLFFDRLCNLAQYYVNPKRFIKPHYEPAIINGEESLILYQTDIEYTDQ